MSSATYTQKSRWFDSAKDNGYSFLIVVEDMIDSVQYPVYADEEDFEYAFNSRNGVNMQKIISIIDIDKDKESQISKDKSWEYPNKAA